VSGDERVAHWIASKSDEDFRAVPIGSGFLSIARKSGGQFTAAAIGVTDVVTLAHVKPLFEIGNKRPEFVVNVPSKAIWSGSAIDFIHDAPAAFGKFGELTRASRGDEAISSYRNKEYDFFERAFRQHSAVSEVTRIYDKVFRLGRVRGMPDVTVVLVDAYDMSAEDVRNARDLYGKFDAALKMSSYGSITTAAAEAAASMDAETFKFGEFLGRLNRR
jgi:hypothetical protein